MARFLQRILGQWIEHRCPAAAAAMAFYTLFSLAPSLVFAIALASHVLGDESTHAAAETWLAGIVGRPQAATLIDLLRATSFRQHGLLPAIVGGLMLLWGASAVFAQLRATLNQIFGFSAASWKQRLRGFVLGRLIAVAFSLSVGLVFIAGIAASTVVGFIAARMDQLGQFRSDAVELLTRGASWLLVVIVFVALLRILPMGVPPWRHVVVSAAVAAALFEAGKYVLATYLTRSLVASAYGPSSAVVAILLWVYYSCQTFLVGAEICRYRMDRERERAARASPRVGGPSR